MLYCCDLLPFCLFLSCNSPVLWFFLRQQSCLKVLWTEFLGRCAHSQNFFISNFELNYFAQDNIEIFDKVYSPEQHVDLYNVLLTNTARENTPPRSLPVLKDDRRTINLQYLCNLSLIIYCILELCFLIAQQIIKALVFKRST